MTDFKVGLEQYKLAKQEIMEKGITVNDRFIQCDPNQVSDGFHTFGELYDHRCLLFIHLLQIHANLSFASYSHDDGTSWKGWFIAGCKLDGGMITYHLPVKFAELIPESIWIYKAPPWDGHTSKDVCDRLIEEAKIQKSIVDHQFPTVVNFLRDKLVSAMGIPSTALKKDE
ncbi:hypothetical protein [Pseudanabaena sp. 'Roaring Creek']|uniref:WDGH domain-containing protein n=1 Tax=Pseudanabaena sp. 'Roaring Creek' TaxID=1681830 RepID=UPI000AF22B3D|nr:hypothetical protein [Pseudanabaena sp. 'Roaring Creek']